MSVRRAGPWSAAERRVLDRLTTPRAIQDFLDATPYSTEPIYRSPRDVLRDRRAHCVDGALFAAMALERLGLPPLVLDLRAVRDDDHVIAVFGVDGLLGAVAKSNTSGLRFREPIHRTARELALSYFADYYNTKREKTLRSYSRPFDLRRLDALGWRTDATRLEELVARLDRLRHFPLLDAAAIARLAPVDDLAYRAGFLDADADGLFPA